MFDTIIVGGRVAGSSLAIQLARKGLRVLLLERSHFPKDTLSTHFVWPRGASYLNRLGLLETVLKSVPSQEFVQLGLEGIEMRGQISHARLASRFERLHGNTHGIVTKSFSARRKFLDHLLLSEAAKAGAEVREGLEVTGLIYDSDRVVGVKANDPAGLGFEFRAKFVVGADGKNSTVAKISKSQKQEERHGCSFAYYTYLSGFNLKDAVIKRRGRMGIGIVPTNDNANMVLAYGPKEWNQSFARNVEENFFSLIEQVDPEIGEIARAAKREERFYGTAEQSAFIRKASSPGLFLIGDAASFKDQCTASGMTHAFRDAELAAEEISASLAGAKTFSDAERDYRERRHLDAWKYFEFVCTQAEMNPVRPEEHDLFDAISKDQKEIDDLIAVFGDTLSPSALLRYENQRRLLARVRHRPGEAEREPYRYQSQFENPFEKSRYQKRRSLDQTCVDFANISGQDLVTRTEGYHDWFQSRQADEAWQYSRTLEASPGPVTSLRDDLGRRVNGINFASQDYLGLANHPEVKEAAIRAIRDFGIHSAGSPMVIGNTMQSEALEKDLCDFLQMPEVMLFPTGWAAGFGSIAGLVRPQDHIVMDKLSHACLQQGAFAATKNVTRHPHLDVESVRANLKDIRSRDKRNGILVISEGIFSMDADAPDLVSLQSVCHEFGARLLVDVAHDLGEMGPNGTGIPGLQKMLGKLDFVMGSFSKTFASNGGFLATKSAGVKQYVKMYGNPHIFSNALSPVQTAVVREALRIVRSNEGDKLRSDLFSVVEHFRNELASHGLNCLGQSCAIVPVMIGLESIARTAHKKLRAKNIAAMILEYPVVATGASRFRLQVMASHTRDQATVAAKAIAESLVEAKRELGLREAGGSIDLKPLEGLAIALSKLP